VRGKGELRKKFSFEIFFRLHLKSITTKGLMIGVELVESKKTRKPLPVEKVGAIFEDTRKKGILIGKGGLYGNGLLLFFFIFIFVLIFIRNSV
jgi:4-aminobutyrate aminotransferase-like enzyme